MPSRLVSEKQKISKRPPTRTKKVSVGTKSEAVFDDLEELPDYRGLDDANDLSFWKKSYDPNEDSFD